MGIYEWIKNIYRCFLCRTKDRCPCQQLVYCLSDMLSSPSILMGTPAEALRCRNPGCMRFIWRLRFQVRVKPSKCLGHFFIGHTKSCFRCCPLPLGWGTCAPVSGAGVTGLEVDSLLTEVARERDFLDLDRPDGGGGEGELSTSGSGSTYLTTSVPSSFTVTIVPSWKDWNSMSSPNKSAHLFEARITATDGQPTMEAMPMTSLQSRSPSRRRLAECSR